MLRWLKPLVAAGWVLFTSHVCLPCPREEKEMWEEICLGWVWKDVYRWAAAGFGSLTEGGCDFARGFWYCAEKATWHLTTFPELKKGHPSSCLSSSPTEEEEEEEFRPVLFLFGFYCRFYVVVTVSCSVSCSNVPFVWRAVPCVWAKVHILHSFLVGPEVGDKICTCGTLFLSKYFPFFDHPHKKKQKKKVFGESNLFVTHRSKCLLYYIDYGVCLISLSTGIWLKHLIEEFLHLFFFFWKVYYWLNDWMTSSCCRFVWSFCFLVRYTLLIFHLSILFLFFTWVFLKLLLADGIAPCVLWKHLCIGIAHWVFLYWNILLGLVDHLCIVIACLVFPLIIVTESFIGLC